MSSHHQPWMNVRLLRSVAESSKPRSELGQRRCGRPGKFPIRKEVEFERSLECCSGASRAIPRQRSGSDPVGCSRFDSGGVQLRGCSRNQMVPRSKGQEMKKIATILIVVMLMAVATIAVAHGESHDNCAKTTHTRTTSGSPSGWSHSKGLSSGPLPLTFSAVTYSYYASQSGGWNYSHNHDRLCFGTWP